MPLEPQQSERGLHLQIDLRPRVQVEYPCGHRWKHPAQNVEARAQYVCGTCAALTGAWVVGHLDPAWEVVPPPVVEVEPPPPNAPALAASQRIAAERWERDGPACVELIQSLWSQLGRPPHASEYQRARGPLPSDGMVIRRMGCRTWAGVMNRVAERRGERAA